VDATLSSQAQCINFNPSGPYAGQYLAAGGSNGLVEVWDAETKGLVRILDGHVKAVTSVQYVKSAESGKRADNQLVKE
jgi:COMPASS component SWD1